jgi:pilus assembly protein CpaE
MSIACGMHGLDSVAFCRSFRGPVRPVADVPSLLALLDRPGPDDLVVLGPAVPDDEVARCVAGVRAARPGAVVVLLRRAPNLLQRHRGLQAGVDAVVAADDVAAAGRACRTFVSARRGAGSGRVITVHAGRGGSGTTTVAVNVPAALAECPSRRVCLLDLDLVASDLAVTLGLERGRTLASDDGAEPDGMVIPLSPRLDCVLAPTTPSALRQLEATSPEQLLAALAVRYTDVVVDTPAVLNPWVHTALELAEHRLLVTTSDRPALVALRRTLDSLDLLGMRRDARSVVVNRSIPAARLSTEDVERLIRSPVAAHLLASADVVASVNARVPVLTHLPHSAVSQAVRDLVRSRLPVHATGPHALAGGAVP